MATAAERRALLFLAGLIAIGGVVRVVKSRGPAAADASAAALSTQIARVDSARSAVPRQRGRSGGKVSARKATGEPLSAPVDMDRADAPELERLPGIGPVVAARIVSDRDSLGDFGSMDGLRRVKGIGPKVAERLAPHVTFSGVARPSNAVISPAGAPPERPRARRAARVP